MKLQHKSVYLPICQSTNKGTSKNIKRLYSDVKINMGIHAVMLCLPSLFCWYNNSEFDTKKKANVKLMSALHGNTRLLGLRDNQFTWQHRAKNIWMALKITGEREEEGVAPYAFLCRPQDGATGLRHAQKGCARERTIISESCVSEERRIHGRKEGKIQRGGMMEMGKYAEGCVMARDYVKKTTTFHTLKNNLG